MLKRQILQAASFGERIAEDEMRELTSYFVETDQWRQLFADGKDIVYGAKGSGKSALYALLVQKSGDLFDRGILLVAAENPSGQPAFQDLATDPPTSESEFIAMWKLYFLALIATVLKEYGVETPHARAVYRALADAGVVPQSGLKKLLQSIRVYLRRIRDAEEVEGGIALDPSTGVPVGFTGKVALAAPDDAHQMLSIDERLADADQALRDLDYRVWIVIDRLDVAFVQHEDVERAALRALFKAYLDMRGLQQVRVKIFLRTDIWSRIAEKGFREASHITRHLHITWERQALLQLVMRRTLKNPQIAEFYGVDPQAIFASVAEQEKLLGRMFPDQVDPGRNLATFEWMLNRTQDGSKTPAPRELIHLLTSLRDSQLRRMEIGHEPPPDELLFERATFKDALAEVSDVRLNQTLLAEYPGLTPYVEAIRGEKTQQTPQTLAHIWEIPVEEATKVAAELAKRGLFETRGVKREPIYWVPFLYRSALEMIQGEAKGFLTYGRTLIDRSRELVEQRLPAESLAEFADDHAGDGYESSSLLFTDTRTKDRLELWFFAAETGTAANFGSRPAVIGVGIRHATKHEFDRDAYRIRLAGAFRWMTHGDGRAGYRIALNVQEFRQRTAEDASRLISERIFNALERSGMVPNFS